MNYENPYLQMKNTTVSVINMIVRNAVGINAPSVFLGLKYPLNGFVNRQQFNLVVNADLPKSTDPLLDSGNFEVTTVSGDVPLGFVNKYNETMTGKDFKKGFVYNCYVQKIWLANTGSQLYSVVCTNYPDTKPLPCGTEYKAVGTQTNLATTLDIGNPTIQNYGKVCFSLSELPPQNIATTKVLIGINGQNYTVFNKWMEPLLNANLKTDFVYQAYISKVITTQGTFYNCIIRNEPEC